jgi:hypothetical protein
MNPLILTICLVGPTPYGDQAPWADVYLELAATVVANHLVQLNGVMTNAAGNVMPLTGTAVFTDRWTAALQGSVRQPKHAYSPEDVEEDPYHLYNAYIESDIPAGYGIRDDVETAWGSVWAHGIQTPEALKDYPWSSDDHADSVPLWSVPCES